MTLAQVEKGVRVRITQRRGASRPRVLEGRGLYPGETVWVVGRAPFAGPLLVELEQSGQRMALDREVAAILHVEPEAPEGG